MKKHAFIIFTALALMACGHHDHEHEGHEHEHHIHEHEHHVHEHEGHEHGDGIKLHSEEAERFGVVVEAIEPGEFHAVVRAAGSVVEAGSDRGIVSAPTAGIVNLSAGMSAGKQVGRGTVVATIDASGITGGDANAAAKAELKAAKREYERVKALYSEQLATKAELQAAESVLATARATYSPVASQGQATAPIAGTIAALDVRQGQYVEAGQAIATISTGKATVLRVDLPQRYYATAPSYTDLVVDAPGVENFSIVERGGRRLGNVSSSSNGAYIPLYFSAPACPLPAGAAFTAYLVGASRENVLTVPVSALSEQQGRFYVYEQHDAEEYHKLPVTLGASDGRRVEILGGIEAGDRIVTDGAAVVRMAEMQSVVPQGHSHNH